MNKTEGITHSFAKKNKPYSNPYTYQTRRMFLNSIFFYLSFPVLRYVISDRGLLKS